MKADQIAYYCATEEAERDVKRMLGLEDKEWIVDRVKAVSHVVGPSGTDIGVNIAKLQFNYDLGIELEIIRYIEGYHWHTYNSRRQWSRPFISHVGFHLADGEDFPEMIGARLVQETFTKSHTSEYLTTGAGAGRKYHYRIHEVGMLNYMKFIKRIHPEPQQD